MEIFSHPLTPLPISKTDFLKIYPFSYYLLGYLGVDTSKHGIHSKAQLATKPFESEVRGNCLTASLSLQVLGRNPCWKSLAAD